MPEKHVTGREMFSFIYAYVSYTHPCSPGTMWLSFLFNFDTSYCDIVVTQQLNISAPKLQLIFSNVIV